MAATLTNVELGRRPIDPFRRLLDEETWLEFERTMRELEAALRGRTLWNVNSTAQGGGVAELLASLIPYDRELGIDERWVVIEGTPAFFALTKRIHNLLHGRDDGDGRITPEELRVYEQALGRNADPLLELVRPGDVVIVHDPQAAGLVPPLAHHGARVIWRSHVGIDTPNDAARSAWDMLRPCLGEAAALVFSRRSHVWEGLDGARVHIIPPTIDPTSVKNQDLDGECVSSILGAAGIMAGTGDVAVLERSGGGGVKVERKADLCGARIPADAHVVTQVSRWDELKDPAGVMQGFASHIAPRTDAHLVLAGPSARSVKDDPEQPRVLRELIGRRERLKASVRDRVVIAQLPMDDVDENAAIVNALQRRADVVVQKSLAEGFGLTVAEAMWKGRPIVASRVGGIEDQIEHDRSGLLIDDAGDLVALGAHVVGLLENPSRAANLGREARRRAIRQYLAPRHLCDQARMILDLPA